MDYPQLNLIFGLVLFFTLVVNTGLRILLTKVHLSVGLSVLSWAAAILHFLSALVIEILFLQLMTPSFNRQIILGLLLMGGIGALVTSSLYRREISSRAAGILLVAQILVSLIGLAIAYGLYRSLVPVQSRPT